MNQTCKVCGEPAAGFHFGAFTCEGCKSFFGRSYNNLSSITECKNNGKCVIDKKNRTTCKACRLRKCYNVGMSKGGSRYGRRSNWFKIHCLLQEQQQQALEAATISGSGSAAGVINHSSVSSGVRHFSEMAAAAAAAAAAHQQLHRQRTSHLAPPPLAYPSYLPEMTSAPFISAAALPFFSMMPSITAGTHSSAFQVPTHLLFSGYHPAAAAAAADAAYRTEVYKHRHSVDSAASAASAASVASTASRSSAASTASNTSPDSQCFSPTNHSVQSVTPEAPANPCNSPELCVFDDENENEVQEIEAEPQPDHELESEIVCSSPLQSASISPVSASAPASALPSGHVIHSPVAVYALPQPHLSVSTNQHNQESSFAMKMQSLSPISVCSISQETAANRSEVTFQDGPMDLSLKASRNATESDSNLLNVTNENDRQLGLRRKFYQLQTESEHLENSSDSDHNKRPKIANNALRNHFHGGHRATALHGIFVCV